MKETKFLWRTVKKRWRILKINFSHWWRFLRYTRLGVSWKKLFAFISLTFLNVQDQQLISIATLWLITEVEWVREMWNSISQWKNDFIHLNQRNFLFFVALPSKNFFFMGKKVELIFYSKVFFLPSCPAFEIQFRFSLSQSIWSKF